MSAFIVDPVEGRTALAAASRDGHLALRRVERQQRLIERLVRAGDKRLTAQALADELGVSLRTVSRDLERLVSSGVPIQIRPGRTGGVCLAARTRPSPIALDIAETAALISSLTALGPSATDSAASAMHKLVASLAPITGP